ncbi:MAG TPA: flagellar protein FlaG [Pyrinomonadaceae bacterium]|nr:flagellar protein FlaG [Pyrinomonadaceae bacterium]
MQINTLNLTLNSALSPQQNSENLVETKAEKPKEPWSEKKQEQVKNLDKLKEDLAEHNISLRFSRDSETNQLVVEMIDGKTGEEVRQFPSEVSLKLAADFVKLQGQFVDEID